MSEMFPTIGRKNRCFAVTMRLAMAGIAVFFTGSYGFTIPRGGGNMLLGAVGMNVNNAKIQQALEKTMQSRSHMWGVGAGPVNAPPRGSPDSMANNLPNLDKELQDGADYSIWLGTCVTKASGRMYEIVEQLRHDPQAFTQGLSYANGVLYESTGMFGQSSVRALDPMTGNVQTNVDMSKEIFGEGMVCFNGKLIQLTWQGGTGYIWDPSDWTKPAEVFTYKTTKENNEGWGITHDPKRNDELIVSDGSDKLIFWDAKTYEILRTVSVTRQNGAPAINLNDIQFWRGRIVANVWYEDVLLVIHPETGTVEKEYDFSTLWPRGKRPLNTDCFNGISASADPDILYVTGKYWNRMYLVKLLP